MITTRRGRCALAAVVMCAVLAPTLASAQDVSARGALIDIAVHPDTVRIGEPFTVRIRVRAAKAAMIRFPAPPDSADAVEAIDPRFIEEGTGTSSTIDRTAVYRLVTWDVGMRTARFAPVTVMLGGATQEFGVVVPPVFVQTVLPADTTDRSPRDVRAPSPEPSGLWRLWFIFAVLGIGLLWYLWKGRGRRTPDAPQIDAFVTAAAAFAALDALGLPEAGESARHVIASVDVMRAYLARRFPTAREALTPGELDAVLEAVDAPVDRGTLRELLRVDAALRFARGTVTVDEAVAQGASARRVVQALQTAYEEQLRIDDRGPQRPKRR